MSTSVLALDIGGANLKAAHSRGGARTRPFALWRHSAALPATLLEFVRQFPPFELLAVTMTGELCDCFETKRQGVLAILDAAAAAAGAAPVRIWQTDGTLADLAAARANPLRAAAGNWLALATFAGRFAGAGPALLIDLGSTTGDIVPLLDGQPVPSGRTDFDRLHAQELVYTGVRRTPLCALLGSRGAAEWFATTQDVYLLLGELREAPDDCDTADGRPATRRHAHARLARMLCADTESFSAAEATQLAQRLRDTQVALLCDAMHAVSRRLPAPPRTVVLSGGGEFLARRAVLHSPQLSAARLVSMQEQLGPDASAAACAFALAALAAESRDGT